MEEAPRRAGCKLDRSLWPELVERCKTRSLREAAKEEAGDTDNDLLESDEFPEEDLTSPVPTAVVHTTQGSVSGRTTWECEVSNPVRVPRKYLVVDMVAIRKAVKAGIRDIPGVYIFEKEGLSVRS